MSRVTDEMKKELVAVLSKELADSALNEGACALLLVSMASLCSYTVSVKIRDLAATLEEAITNFASRKGLDDFERVELALAVCNRSSYLAINAILKKVYEENRRALN